MLERVAIGSEEWAELRQAFVKAQAGRCPICWVKLELPQLDHCHHTSFIRGALCFSCNSKLGWYERYRRPIEGYLARAAAFIASETPLDSQHTKHREEIGRASCRE